MRRALISVAWFLDHCQVADDRTQKGMVKISAVVDSGAEANALPENMM